MLVTKFLTLLRAQINDVNKVRWTDAVLAPMADAGQRHIVGLRPEARFKTAVETGPLADLPTAPDADDNLGIIDDYALALAHYVAWMIFFEDTDDEANARLAASHWDAYVKEMG